MLTSYHAILRNNRLEWLDEAPPFAHDDTPHDVYVTVTQLSDRGEHNRGVRMAAILEQLATGSAFAEISDPVVWQREQRVDRELSDRESR